MAAAYLPDSSIIIAALKASSASLLNRLAVLAPSRLHLSSIVLAELQAGAELSRDPSASRAALTELTRYMTPLPFDAEASEVYGRIRARLERAGRMIGAMDLLIAAQAVSAGLVLVTDNLREFRRVPGIQCKNWLRASKATD